MDCHAESGLFHHFPSRFAEKPEFSLLGWHAAYHVGNCGYRCTVGVSAGVYLEEYARKNWVTNLIEINIANLAGVPSIVYGLMALGLLVYQFRLGQSILTGGLTLAF